MKTHYSTLFFLLFSFPLLWAQPSFIIESAEVQPGETVCLSLKVQDFTDLQETQFSIAWDTSVIKYNSVDNLNAQIPDLDFGDFDTSLSDEGKLGFSWKNGVGCTGNTGVTIGDFSVFFDLCFEVVGDLGGSTSVVLGDVPVSKFATRLNANCINILMIETPGVINICPSDCPKLIIKSGWLPPEYAFPNQTICLDVKGGHMIEINGIQYSLAWDSSALQFQGIQSLELWQLDEDDFDLSQTESGILTMDWEINDHVTHLNEEVFYQICFEAIGQPGTYDLTFIDSPIAKSMNSTAGPGGIFYDWSIEIITPNPDVTLHASNLVSFPNDNICVNIGTDSDTDLDQFDFNLHWDSSVLEFESFETHEDFNSNFATFIVNENLTSQGILSVEYKSDVWGISNTILDSVFSVCYKVIGEPDDFTLIEFRNQPLLTQLDFKGTPSVENPFFPTISNGSVYISTPPFHEIFGTKDACSGSILTYKVQPTDTCVTDYNWSITPPIGNITSNSNSDSITIEWTSPGITQLCVEGIDSCGLSLSVCEIIEVTLIPPTDVEVDLCIGGTTICAGQVFNTSGFFPVVLESYLGCDSLVNCIIVPIPPIVTDLGEVPICGNTPFVVCDSSYYEIGTHVHTCQSFQGCDSTIIFDLVAFDSLGIQSITPDTVLCGGGDIQLNVDAPSAVSYHWFPEDNLSCFDCPNPIATVAYGQFFFVTVTDMNGCTATEQVLVDVHFGLDWGLLPFSNSPICEGDTLMFFDIFNFDIVEYEWTGPNGFNSTLSNPFIVDVDISQSGNYTANFVSDAGCQGTSDVFVDIVECFDFINLTTLPVSCMGSEDGFIHFEIINGSGDYTISWFGPIPNIPPLMELENLPMGTYHLTVTDNISGSTRYKTFVVGLSPSATIADAGEDIYLPCNGGPLTTLDGSGSSTGANIEYFWEVNSGTPGLSITEQEKINPEVSGTGCFKLTVTNTDTGCTAEDVVCTIVPPPVMFSIGSDTEFSCDNNPIQIDTLDTNLGNFLDFEWDITSSGQFLNNSDTTLTPTVSGPGNYTLTIIDTQTGCSDTQSLFIDDLSAKISDDPVVLTCDGILINADSSSIGENLTYEWMGPCILSNPNELEIQIDDCLGTYYFTVTDTILQCSVTDSLTIDDINVNTVLPIAEITPPEILTCTVTTIILDGSDSSTGIDIVYQWTDSGGAIIGNDISVNVSEPGIYTLEVTDLSNGCQATEQVVIESQIDLPVADAGPDMVLDCNNPQVLLDGLNSWIGPDIEYFWTTTDGNIISGDLTLSPIVDSAGTYILTVINTADGCENTDTAIVTADFDVVPFTIDDQYFCQGDTLFLDISFLNAETYIWTPSLNIDDPTSPIVTIIPTQNTVYNVTATFANGCQSSAFFSTFFEVDCLWPGDTDTSWQASNADILMIGLAYGELGPPRPDTTINWERKFAFDWSGITPQSGINYKHADTDGNGIVNASDTLAIVQNWGLTHNFLTNEDKLQNSDDRDEEVPFYIEPDTIFPEQKYALPIILGTEDFEAENVYGVSFSINYDPEIVVEGSANVGFDTSWLGEHNADMISIQKDSHSEGRIDIGVTRIDAQNMIGYGQLGTVFITIEDIIFVKGNDDTEEGKETYFEIDNVTIISFNEDTLVVDTNPFPAMISNNKNTFLESEIDVFPNPTNDDIHIISKEVGLEKIELLTVDGIALQTLQVLENEITMNTSRFKNGIYFLKIQTEKGVLIKRIILM